MAGKTLYLSNKLLNHTLRGEVYTPSDTLYVGLFTTSPTDDSNGIEVSGGSYERVLVTFTEATNKISVNSGTISFPLPTVSWGTIVAVGIFDAITDGNLLYYNTLITSGTASIGAIVEFLDGELEISEE